MGNLESQFDPAELRPPGSIKGRTSCGFTGRKSFTWSRISVNKPNLFVFKVTFNDSDGFDPQHGAFSLEGRSAVVAVEPEGMARLMGIRHSSEVDRYLAEEVAQQTALQTIRKDFAEGFMPRYDLVQLQRLPDELQRRLPTLHAGRACAWLL